MKQLRSLSGDAYRAELSKVLKKLGDSFKRWEKGDLDVFDLDQEIHQYHDEAGRELYKQYVMNRNVVFSVARGIDLDLISKDEIDSDLLEKLADSIKIFKQNEKT